MKLMKFKFEKEKWLNAGKYAVCVCLFIAIGAAHYYAVQWAESLHVKKITVDGNTQLKLNEVLTQLKLSPDSYLMDDRIETMQKNLLANPWIRTVEVERILPSTIHISMTERMPIAMIAGKETVLSDSDGIILHQLPDRPVPDVPVISTAFHMHELCCDKTLPYQLSMSLQVAREAFRSRKDMYYALSEIHTDENADVVLYTLDSAIPIMVGKGGIEEKLWKVSEFWKKTMTPAAVPLVLSIDARFKERIIVKWKNTGTESQDNKTKI